MNRPTVHPHARLMSIQQAAIESGLSTGMLRRLIANGDLPCVRVPNERRIFIERRVLQQHIDRWTEVAS